MMAATGVRVVEAGVGFEEQRLRTPLLLSSGAISAVTLATARVTVEGAGAARASGAGAIYLSDLWAWPSAVVEHQARDGAMRALCEALVDLLPRWASELRHPLDHGMACEHAVDALAESVSRGQSLMEPIPRLAALTCLSIFD